MNLQEAHDQARAELQAEFDAKVAERSQALLEEQFVPMQAEIDALKAQYDEKVTALQERRAQVAQG